MSRSAGPLATYVFDGDAIDVDLAVLKTRIAPVKRPQLTNAFGRHTVFLHSTNRVDPDNIHQPQQFDALAIQAVGRNAAQACTRCAQAGQDQTQLIFRLCRQARNQPGACGNCTYIHRESQCSLNPAGIQVPSAAAGVMPSASLRIRSPPVHDRGTRARTSAVGAALSGPEACPPQRQPNRQRLPTNQSTTSRGRLQGAGSNAGKDESLFLSQDEDEPMDMGTETHSEHDGNFDGFESEDFEAGRFDSIEPQVVVPAPTGGTEASGSLPTGASTTWAPRPRRPRVAEGVVDVFPREVWRGLTSLTYKRKYQTMLDENGERVLGTVLAERRRQEGVYATLAGAPLPDIQMRDVESNGGDEE